MASSIIGAAERAAVNAGVLPNRAVSRPRVFSIADFSAFSRESPCLGCRFGVWYEPQIALRVSRVAESQILSSQGERRSNYCTIYLARAKILLMDSNNFF